MPLLSQSIEAVNNSAKALSKSAGNGGTPKVGEGDGTDAYNSILSGLKSGSKLGVMAALAQDILYGLTGMNWNDLVNKSGQGFKTLWHTLPDVLSGKGTYSWATDTPEHGDFRYSEYSEKDREARSRITFLNDLSAFIQPFSDSVSGAWNSAKTFVRKYKKAAKTAARASDR